MGSVWFIEVVIGLVICPILFTGVIVISRVQAMERIGLARDLRRLCFTGCSIIFPLYVVIVLLDLHVLPMKPWETVVTWLWVALYTNEFVVM